MSWTGRKIDHRLAFSCGIIVGFPPLSLLVLLDTSAAWVLVLCVQPQEARDLTRDEPLLEKAETKRGNERQETAATGRNGGTDMEPKLPPVAPFRVYVPRVLALLLSPDLRRRFANIPDQATAEHTLPRRRRRRLAAFSAGKQKDRYTVLLLRECVPAAVGSNSIKPHQHQALLRGGTTAEGSIIHSCRPWFKRYGDTSTGDGGGNADGLLFRRREKRRCRGKSRAASGGGRSTGALCPRDSCHIRQDSCHTYILLSCFSNGRAQIPLSAIIPVLTPSCVTQADPSDRTMITTRLRANEMCSAPNRCTHMTESMGRKHATSPDQRERRAACFFARFTTDVFSLVSRG